MRTIAQTTQRSTAASFRVAPVTAIGGLRPDIDPYRAALFLLTVISFSRIHQRFSALAMLRPGVLLVGVAAAYALLNHEKLASGSMFRTPPARVIAALGVFACLSIPFGISIGSSGLFIISTYSKTLMFAGLIILGMRNARDVYTFIWAYVAGTAVLCWMAIFLFDLSTQGSLAARLGRLEGWDANDAGVVMVVGLSLTLLTFQASGRLGRLVSAVVLVGIGATVARTGSRGAFLGLLAVGIALLLMLTSVSWIKRLGIVVATALALALWAPPGYWEQMSTMLKPADDYNWSETDGRKQVALRGLSYMMAYPVFGLGINNFSKAECTVSEKARNHEAGTGLRCTAAHNSYVEVGAELGIPGLILWMLMVFGGIRWMVILKRRLPTEWARGTPEERFLFLAPMYLAVAMIGFAVSAAFVSFAWLDLVYFLAALMAGVWAVTEKQLAGVGHSRAHPPRIRGGRAGQRR